MEHLATEIPWWGSLVEVTVSALAAALTAILAVLTPLIRKWLIERYKLASVLRDETLARKMDEGAINIIKAVEKRLIESIPGDSPLYLEQDRWDGDVTVPSSMDIITIAQPILQREFKETLDHFNKTPDAVKDYLLARINHNK